MKKFISVIIVVSMVLVVSLLHLGSVLLFDVDEAVFAEATKEMVESGDYITATYNGEVRYDKPIFFYWLMAASYKIFGINEFGARFPSALAGCILALALFFFVRHSWGRQKASYAVLSMVLSLYYLVYARSAVTDMVLTLFITLSLFCFYLSLQKNRLYLYGFYVFSALAFLTKGLIGIVFPCSVALIYLVVTEGPGGIRRILDIKGLMLFIIIGTPWYVLEYSARGYEFIEQFFIKHHFRRYTEVISGHKGPVYYYLAALAVGMFPWIAFLPAGVGRLWKDRDPLLVFSGIWLAFVMIFFSFSTTKLPDYILSAVPAASIIIAAGMTEEGAVWRRSAYGVMGLTWAAIGFVFFVLPSYLEQKGIAADGVMPLLAVVALTMTAVCFYALYTARPLYGAMSSVMFVFLMTAILTGLPIANNYLQGSLYKYSIYGNKKAKGDERIIAYGLNKPSIVFYSGHKVAVAGGIDTLKSIISDGKGRIVIAKTKDAELLRQSGLVIRDMDKGYALLETE